MIEVLLAEQLAQVHIVALEIVGITVGEPSAKLRMWADEMVAVALKESSRPEAEKLRTAVRQMLRHGKFKASGRSKPAQEYLLRCAQEEGALPRINGPVDVLNVCSLIGGLPISLLSLRKCSGKFLIRYGAEDESFVFNASGQLLDVEDLIVTCDAAHEPSRPVGTPIKDSMAGKIELADTRLVAIIYAPRTQPGIIAALRTASLLADNMVAQCQATVGQMLFLGGTD